jgi:hypothetical protein
VNNEQAVEKVFFLSLRGKRGNLAFNEINGLEIASSQKLLLAMTCDEFFNSLFNLHFKGCTIDANHGDCPMKYPALR